MAGLCDGAEIRFFMWQRSGRCVAWKTLQAAGKGFETVLIVPKEPYLDQVLLGGAVKPEFTGQRQDAAYRVQMAGRFVHLLTEESQHQLSQAGLSR